MCMYVCVCMYVYAYGIGTMKIINISSEKTKYAMLY